MTEPKTDVIEALKNIQIKEIKDFASKLYNIKRQANKVYICGNGGNSSSASHFASDLMSLKFNVVCMVDNISRISALINDFGWEKLYTLQMNHFAPGDAIFIFTVHGASGEQEAGPWSQNLLSAAILAKEKNGCVFVISGNNGGYLKQKFPKETFLTIKSGDVNVVEGVQSVLAHLVCHELKKLIPK